MRRIRTGRPVDPAKGFESMRQHKRVKSGPPLLHRSDDGTPLSRELTTLRLMQLVDFINRSASREFPRLSGLSDFEWRAVALVCETPRLSINDLSSVLHRGVAQVSRTVKKLVAAGLLHRAKRNGGPGVLISPTPLGRTIYDPLERHARKRNAAFVAGLSAADLKVLDRCIAIMTPNARALLEREQGLQAVQGESRSGAH